MPASTVTEYLAALRADRRDALNEVRRGINRALRNRFAEKLQMPSPKLQAIWEKARTANGR